MSLLTGKHGVVLGVANKRSIAWAIAQALAGAGMRLAFTYQGERLKENVEELASTLPGSVLYPCDVAVDGATGGLGVRVPIRLTVGRGSVQPSLALEYRGGSGASAFGQDWVLTGVPAVTRGPPDALPDDEHEAYAYAGQELVPERLAGDAGAAARTASRAGYLIRHFRLRAASSPRRFELWRSVSDPTDTHWRIRDSNGTVTILGRDAAGRTRIQDPSDNGRVAAWLPEASYDSIGNADVYAREIDAIPAKPRKRVGP